MLLCLMFCKHGLCCAAKHCGMVRVTETSNTVNVHHVFGHFLEKTFNFLKSLPVVGKTLPVVKKCVVFVGNRLDSFLAKNGKKTHIMLSYFKNFNVSC